MSDCLSFHLDFEVRERFQRPEIDSQTAYYVKVNKYF